MYKYIQMHICIRKHTETRYKYFYTHTCTHISDTQSHICVFITHTQTHSHTHSHTYTHKHLSHDPLRSNEDTQPRRDAEGLLRALHTWRRKINIKKKTPKTSREPCRDPCTYDVEPWTSNKRESFEDAKAFWEPCIKKKSVYLRMHVWQQTMKTREK